MSEKKPLVLASANKGKLQEMQSLLEPFNWDLVAQSALGVSEAAEPFGTFVENALAKARHASDSTGLAAIADDSGLCLPLLGNRPGVRSARLAQDAGQLEAIARDGTDRANNQQLIRLLREHGVHEGHGVEAYFVSVLVMLRHPQDPEPVIAQGRWYGRFVFEPMGEHGFGYDPHFFLPAQACTAAQLPPAQKNRFSHRAIAMQRLVAELGAS